MVSMANRALLDLLASVKRPALLLVGAIALILAGPSLASHHPVFSGKGSVVGNPNAGRIYVLDSKRSFEHGEVLVISPTEMRVERRIPTGYRPDFVVSPDGTRLFVTSTEGPPQVGTLVVIDPISGTVVDRQVLPDRMMYTVMPTLPTLVASAKGRWVFVGKDRWTPSDALGSYYQEDKYTLAAYDARQGILSKKDVAISEDCDGMHLVPSPSRLYVICSSQNSVYSYPMTDDGLGSPQVIGLPRNPRQVFDGSLDTTAVTTPVYPAIAGGVLSADESILTVFTSYLRAIQIDISTGRIVRVEQVVDDRWALPNGVISSPDGSRIYVAVGPVSSLNMGPGADEILVLNSESLAQVGNIRPASPVWSPAVSKDGQYLFVLAPKAQTLYVIDTTTGLEVSRMTDFADLPTRVATALSPE
ncbi:MAG TPA: hypothetical protein VGR97_12445 [Candidatus Acidoferrales bacterium]|nr:hypothetical protein [Candidatus Acidoferrales bacterium]